MSSLLFGCLCSQSAHDVPTEIVIDEDERRLDEEEPVDRSIDLSIANKYISYSTRIDQPLRTLPLCEGSLWYLNTDDSVHAVYLSIYVNGFTISDSTAEESAVFSPFSLVRNCKLTDSPNESVNKLKMFKLSLFSQGVIHFFGVEDDVTRSRWVINASHAIRTVTHSLFPPYKLRCLPLPENPLTSRRILAGYLIYNDSESCTTLLYVEVHPPSLSDNRALLRVYKTESCAQHVKDIYIDASVRPSETPGINCSCFNIGDHLFTTRTMAERKLWLRTISNLQVKIYNKSPPPDEDELRTYRYAIQEYIKELGDAVACSKSIEPLLRPANRRTNPFEGK